MTDTSAGYVGASETHRVLRHPIRVTMGGSQLMAVPRGRSKPESVVRTDDDGTDQPNTDCSMQQLPLRLAGSFIRCRSSRDRLQNPNRGIRIVREMV
jgi:hypothetical protein